MALRRLIKQAQRHQSEFGKAKHLFKIIQDYTRNRLSFSQQRFKSSNLGNLYLSEAREASHLKKLSHEDGPEAVISAFESQPSLHTNSVALSEYVKALVQVDGLDESELLKSLRRAREEESSIFGDFGWAFKIWLVGQILCVVAAIKFTENDEGDAGITVLLKADNIDVKIIAWRTPEFSGADLANLVNVAALKAAMDGAKAVSMHDFDYARDKIKMGS